MTTKFKHHKKDNISKTNLSGLELKKVLWWKERNYEELLPFNFKTSNSWGIKTNIFTSCINIKLVKMLFIIIYLLFKIINNSQYDKGIFLTLGRNYLIFWQVVQ